MCDSHLGGLYIWGSARNGCLVPLKRGWRPCAHLDSSEIDAIVNEDLIELLAAM